MKQPNLDQQILESIIRASLLEQQAAPKPVGGLFPDTPEQAKLRTQVRQDIAKNKPKVTNPAVTPSGGVPHWKTARAIYDSKGYVWDDEKGALTAIKAGIKNIKDYKAVTKELQKISGGRGIGAYLHSFMNAKQLFGVAEYLMKVLPENQWHWTIKNIVAWDDILAFIKYISPDRGGIIPKSERRRNANQLFSDLYSNWKQDPAQAKKDPLFKMVTHPMLYKDYAPYLKNEYEKWENHEDRFMASIVYSFIPYIGPYLSSAIMAADAQAYIDEGDSYTGGLYYTFAALPLAGGLVSKLISRVGLAAKGGKYWKQLGSKMAKAYKSGKLPALTKSEQKLMELLRAADKNVIVSDLKAAMPKLKQSISAATKKTAAQQTKSIISKLSNKNIPLATKEAVLRTMKSGPAKVGATLAVYMGSAMLYDKVYMAIEGPSDAELTAMWTEADAELEKHLIARLDRMRTGKSIQTESLLREDDTGMSTSDEDLGQIEVTDEGGSNTVFYIIAGLSAIGLIVLYKTGGLIKKGTGALRKFATGEIKNQPIQRLYNIFKTKKALKNAGYVISKGDVRKIIFRKIQSDMTKIDGILTNMERDLDTMFKSGRKFTTEEAEKAFIYEYIKQIRALKYNGDFQVKLNVLERRFKSVVNNLEAGASKSGPKPNVKPTPYKGSESWLNKGPGVETAKQFEERVAKAKAAGYFNAAASEAEKAEIMAAVERSAPNKSYSINDRTNLINNNLEAYRRFKLKNGQTAKWTERPPVITPKY